MIKTRWQEKGACIHYNKQKKTKRVSRFVFYMVEDKMKKMKNCYLHHLIKMENVSKVT